MKSICRLYLFLSVFIPLTGMRIPHKASHVPARPSQAMNLAHRIVHKRNKAFRMQHDLVQTLSNISSKKFKPEHINPIITALVHLNGVPLLEENKVTFERSIRQFITVPGFFPTLQRLFAHASTDLNNFKGTLYELEHALKIAQKNKGEKILGLNQRISCPEKIIKKEFDICTTHGFVECKNINWPSNSTHAHYLRTQFEQQNKIVKLLNAANEHEFYFRVSSKERIPNAWCQWFEDQDIAFSW